MSLSKEKLTVSAEKPRKPKCTRCRHHGIIVPQKGHMKFCPFINCGCWKCHLITQRTLLTARQRNLNRAQKKHPKKEQRSGPSEETPSPAALTGGVSPESVPSTSGSSHGVWSRPEEPMSGLDASNVAEEGPSTPVNVPYLRGLGQTAPLPGNHFPFRMSDHYPSSYAPCHNFLLRMPWLPPVPAGLYNSGLQGPLTFTHFQQGAVIYPPPPEPGPPADCGQVFFTLQPPTFPEPFQEELMSRQPSQPPLPKLAEQDVEELQ